MIDGTFREALAAAARQDQFLELVDCAEATARLRRHLRLGPLGSEIVQLADALGRVLAEDVEATIDVPLFDRANVDGFALRAADTAGANAARPARLRLMGAVLTPGRRPADEVGTGQAALIATGGMLPRGADAVVMIEHTEVREDGDGVSVAVGRPALPGQHVAATGSDIGRGETVLRMGEPVTSRAVAVLAALGRAAVEVWRRPTVAIISTGDELVQPGEPIDTGQVYDSNGAVLAAAVAEAGGLPIRQGIVRDDEPALVATLERALACDMVILSGGTSKGAGDLAFKAVRRLGDPGLLVHGVALKPGKPVCLAVTHGRPVIVLPGFPTSAIVTFHEFAAPVIRAWGGRTEAAAATLEADLPVPLASERGRLEYVLVSLVAAGEGQVAAFPTVKGSGAVTAFSQADGFITVPAGGEAVPAGSRVTVQLLAGGGRAPDLAIIGSHCVGLDRLIGHLIRRGLRVKSIPVGSQGGLVAARRGECDIAPIHLLDPATGTYNRPFLTEGIELAPGYRRLQGVVFRPGDRRFEGLDAGAAIVAVAADPSCLLVNRNSGSGTRILLDRLLGESRPTGYWSQARSHNAVAAAVAQGRADWGVAISAVATTYGLGFLPLQVEHYDFVVPASRAGRSAVQEFLAVLAQPSFRTELADLGFDP